MVGQGFADETRRREGVSVGVALAAYDARQHGKCLHVVKLRVVVNPKSKSASQSFKKQTQTRNISSMRQLAVISAFLSQTDDWPRVERSDLDWDLQRAAQTEPTTTTSERGQVG